MTCPFCRYEIRSTEQIIVDPFEKMEPIPGAGPILQQGGSTDDEDSSSFEVSICR